MRIIPYRTTDNRIDGLVMTFSGIHEQITQQQRLQQAKDEAETKWELLKLVFDMNPDPLAVLDHDGNIVIANTALFRLIDFAPESAEHEKSIKFPADIFTNAELELAGEKNPQNHLRRGLKKIGGGFGDRWL